MRRSGKGSGGGIGMNKNVRPGYRTGQGAIKADLRGVSQIGQGIGNKITEKTGTLPNTIKPLREGPMGGMGAIKLGNQVAASSVCQPGGSRTIMRSGQQSTWGRPNPGRSPERKDILSEYGGDGQTAARRR